MDVDDARHWSLVEKRECIGDIPSQYDHAKAVYVLEFSH